MPDTILPPQLCKQPGYPSAPLASLHIRKSLTECQKFRGQTESRSVAVQRMGQAISLGPAEQQDQADNLRLQAGIHQSLLTEHIVNRIVVDDMHTVLPHAHVLAPATDAAVHRRHNSPPKVLLSEAKA